MRKITVIGSRSECSLGVYFTKIIVKVLFNTNRKNGNLSYFTKSIVGYKGFCIKQPVQGD